MTWTISIVGHKDGLEWAGPEHQAQEAALAARAREFVASLDDGVISASFNGSTRHDSDLRPQPEAEPAPEEAAT